MTLVILSASMAVEVSAFLIANVPPKPQHGVGRRQLDQVMPAHVAQQFQRLVADPQHPQGVAGGVVGDPVRVVGADIAHVEHVDQQFGQLVGARRHGVGPPRQGGVAGPAGHHRVLVANRADAGSRWRDRGLAVGVLEDLDVMTHQRGAASVEITRVDVHLAAAGLPRGKTTW